MKRRFVWLLAAAALVTVMSLTGCGGTSALEDTKWILQSYGDSTNPQKVLDGSEITATFKSENDSVTGSAGCNSYFGDYELKGDTIEMGMLGNTEMACMEPEGVMDQEQEYLKILGTAESYSVEGDTLTITCGDDVLVYSAAGDTD